MQSFYGQALRISAIVETTTKSPSTALGLARVLISSISGLIDTSFTVSPLCPLQEMRRENSLPSKVGN
jgi:hypothetical protein